MMKKIYLITPLLILIFCATHANYEEKYGNHDDDRHEHQGDSVYYLNPMTGEYDQYDLPEIHVNSSDNFDAPGSTSGVNMSVEDWSDEKIREEEEKEEPMSDMVNFKMKRVKTLKDVVPKTEKGKEVFRPSGTDIPGLIGTVFIEMFEDQVVGSTGEEHYSLRSSITHPYHRIDSTLQGRVPLWEHSSNTFTDSVLNLQNGRLGIGIQPQASLHVAGVMQASGELSVGASLNNNDNITIISNNNVRHSAVGIGNNGGLYAYNGRGDLGARLGGGSTSDLELNLDRASVLRYTGAKLGVGVFRPKNTVEVSSNTSGNQYCDTSKTRCFTMNAGQDDSVMIRSAFQNYLESLTIFPDKQ